MSFRSKHFRFFIVLFLAIIVSAQSDAKPKNIIFMIGDGMGIAHVTAAKIVKGSIDMERCKVMGMHMTASADNPVTDSAAAGTALSTGFRTNNDVVGLCPEGKPLKNLMEYAHETGRATGVAVTVILTHATPAAFYAHHKARYHYDIIADQMIESGLDVMIGGGWNNFYPKTFTGSRRKDDRNLILELRKKMPVVTSYESLMQADGIRQITAMLDGGHLPHASKRDYTLGNLTDKAISLLNQNQKGFVLMVEGSQIDLAAHDNDMQRVIDETLDFDTAVKSALDFAVADGNTLVVITADHETGGLSFPYKSIEGNKIVAGKFSSDNHTAAMVPVFAFGPDAEKFGGIYDNTHIGKTLIELVKCDAEPCN
ncbi:MAG: Alkaline phosphatase [Candidatus Rifleibacterium amylolyticum]|nr:MAG: Alkaline phosphatase [Candidatus Rifleibacterium amylolyticum]NLF97937.1 alkaline phosphatase [Candidatus Riflebacteria bacterium]